MFEPVVSSLLDTFSGVEDAGVVAAIGVASGEENAACARRLEAMGELYARRAPEDDDERTGWLVDGYESLAAEVAAELGISRDRATGQLRYAIHLREKLPQLMRVFVTGAIDMRMVITIVNRVVLITDAAARGHQCGDSCARRAGHRRRCEQYAGGIRWGGRSLGSRRG